MNTGHSGKLSGMKERAEEKRMAILRILREADKPLGSLKITERLSAMGHDISERTVRFHLLDLDKAGLTDNLGRNGRSITQRGQNELESHRGFAKVGILSAKIDQMTYKMDFDLAKKTGTVVANVSVIPRDKLDASIPLMSRVFAAGYAMGKLIALLSPGEQVGQMAIPEGSVGIATVCSITVNGVLVAHGIPTNSRFGGLLELRDHKPTRWAEFINYDGTTLDPLEIFIRSVMTDYVGATRNGNGLIGASFREVPADSREHVLETRPRDGQGRSRRHLAGRLARSASVRDPRQRGAPRLRRHRRLEPGRDPRREGHPRVPHGRACRAHRL